MPAVPASPHYSPDGSCPCPCNYQTDTGCTCRDLQSSISISLSKSTVWASYPMEYLQTFNYKPYEAVVRPSNNVCLVRLPGGGPGGGRGAVHDCCLGHSKLQCGRRLAPCQ